jgi:hypothetical protein
VDETLISTNDLKRYKNILEMTNAPLMGYEPGGDILIFRVPKFANVISKLFFAEQTARHRIRIKTAFCDLVDSGGGIEQAVLQDRKPTRPWEASNCGKGHTCAREYKSVALERKFVYYATSDTEALS